jgi:endonuclease/exonuclease/phosphatase family metal-dependent hydrolase
LVETRYALLAELRNSPVGRLLVVNTHLHHGLEPSQGFLQELERLFDCKTVSAAQRDEILKLLDGARERRARESNRLLDRIEKLRAEYDGVILAGDMNADPNSATIQQFRNRDLVDIVPAGLNTWDKAANPHIFHLSENFELAIPDFGIAAVRTMLRAHEARPTRLDYILTSKKLSDRVESVNLFGHNMHPEKSISDHFGICATLH